MSPDPGRVEMGDRATNSLKVAGESFTIRGLAAGLLVGLVICFSNMYFGLQTGWYASYHHLI